MTDDAGIVHTASHIFMNPSFPRKRKCLSSGSKRTAAHMEMNVSMASHVGEYGTNIVVLSYQDPDAICSSKGRRMPQVTTDIPSVTIIDHHMVYASIGNNVMVFQLDADGWQWKADGIVNMTISKTNY